MTRDGLFRWRPKPAWETSAAPAVYCCYCYAMADSNRHLGRWNPRSRWSKADNLRTAELPKRKTGCKYSVDASFAVAAVVDPHG